MNESPQDQNLTGNEPQPYDRREARRQRIEERRAARGNSGWIVGVILIVAGVLILLQNMGLTFLNNWWALFILIPAIGAFANAWRMYQNAGGHLTAAARGSLITGLILTLVAAVFLFGLNWSILGPVLIILVGLGILLNTMLPT